jgi:hypothetical protein
MSPMSLFLVKNWSRRSSSRVRHSSAGCGVAQSGCNVTQSGCGVPHLACGVAQLGCGVAQSGCLVAQHCAAWFSRVRRSLVGSAARVRFSARCMNVMNVLFLECTATDDLTFLYM